MAAERHIRAVLLDGSWKGYASVRLPTAIAISIILVGYLDNAVVRSRMTTQQS